MYLLDDVIQTIMKMSFKEEEFNKKFTSIYPKVAKMCWKSKNYSKTAQSLDFDR